MIFFPERFFFNFPARKFMMLIEREFFDVRFFQLSRKSFLSFIEVSF